MYDIVYSEKAEEDLAKLRRSEPATHKKAVMLLIYEIFETEVHVDVLSAYGHYGDKLSRPVAILPS